MLVLFLVILAIALIVGAAGSGVRSATDNTAAQILVLVLLVVVIFWALQATGVVTR